jgi:SGNH domain (fused to AT3 domains)
VTVVKVIPHSDWPRRAIVGALVIGLTVCVVTRPGAAGASYPRCFGAASRDPLHRCMNPKLAHTVVPTPSDALLMPDAPCQLIEAPIDVCAFGVPAAMAARTAALVGDSHAAHWRAALEVLAPRLRWEVLSITRSSCPFTQGLQLAPEPGRAECVRWNQAVVTWLAGHPEVSTIVISDHPGPVRAAPGQSRLEALVAGIEAAWQALPTTVEHIIVIRDGPLILRDTLPCVERAIAKRKDAGQACAVRRSVALHRDPDVVAAELLRSRRVQVVDLTRFFCGSRLCYPVVGGALVYRDYYDHLTTTFAATLGPFLLTQIERLMKLW